MGHILVVPSFYREKADVRVLWEAKCEMSLLLLSWAVSTEIAQDLGGGRGLQPIVKSSQPGV